MKLSRIAWFIFDNNGLVCTLVNSDRFGRKEWWDLNDRFSSNDGNGSNDGHGSYNRHRSNDGHWAYNGNFWLWYQPILHVLQKIFSILSVFGVFHKSIVIGTHYLINQWISVLLLSLNGIKKWFLWENLVIVVLLSFIELTSTFAMAKMMTATKMCLNMLCWVG